MKLATATVLAVLCAGPAAAAGVAGAYRDVGPRVEKPYDGRVPAWITTARVSRVGPKRYSIRMSTGRPEPGGCTGEVTAKGTLIGTAIMAAEATRQIASSRSRSSAALCESANRATASPSEGCSATSAATSGAREAAAEQSLLPATMALKPARKLQHLSSGK